MRILVHVHIYYPELWPELKCCVKNIMQTAYTDVFVTSSQADAGLLADIQELGENVKFLQVPNKGFDVGPFFYVLNRINLEDYDYVVKLHTKRNITANPWLLNDINVGSAKWRHYLINFCITPDKWRKTLKALENPHVGMISDKHVIMKKDVLDQDDVNKVLKVLLQLGFNTQQKKEYVAGTMFVVKAFLLNSLQHRYDLDDFEESSRQKELYLAHIMERIFGYLVCAQGYSLESFDGKKISKWRKLWNPIRKFLCYHKYGNGKDVIKICKIPLPITIKKSIFNGDKKTKYKILGMTVLKIINNDDFCQKEFCFYSKIDFFYHNCNHLTIDTLKRASLLRPTKLFFDLSLGGGTESYFYQTKDDLLNTFNVIRIQYISAIKYYKISLYNGAGTYVLWVNNFFKLRKIIGSLQLDEVILNHIIGFPDIFTILDMISQFKGKTKISARAHDYFSVCPSLNLMIKDVFCGGPEIHKCKHCFSSKIVEKKLAGIKTKSINIEQWRNKWNNFYTKIADELIVFSNSSLNLFKNAYPEINNIKVVPHKIQPLRKVNIRQHQRINIAILGMITGIAKGELVINHIEKIVPAYKNVKIFVFGCYQNNSNAITVLGKYKREELPRLMEEYNIDIVFIPSVCPETFSYTTSEAMTMGLPVACFNIGAQAEKIKKYQKGLIISEINAQIALNDIINFIRKEKTAC